MKKRILSVLMCLSMVLSLLPAVTPPAAAEGTTPVLDYIVKSNDTEIMRTNTTAVTNTQEVAIGGTPMLPTSMEVRIDGSGKYTDAASFTTTIKDSSNNVVNSIDASKAGTYTVTVALPAGYELKSGVGEPTMIVKVGSTVYENMYAANTDAKPVPYGDYNVLGQTTWQKDTVNGGLRTTKLMPGNNTQYYQLTISIPNDAYYEVTADLGVTAPAMAADTSQPTLTIGIVEDTNGRQVFSSNTACTWIYPSQALNNLGLGDYKTERYEATPGKTSFQSFPYPADSSHSVFGGTLAKKGGDVQFLVGLEYFHNAIDGTAFYGTIKNVKLKKLTNSYSISTTGTGSGTFDVDWKDSDKLDCAAQTTSAGTIGRGDTATLTAHANSGSRFVGWYQGDTCVSVDRVFSFVAGTSAADTGSYSYTAKFESGADPVLSNLVDTSTHNADKAMVADVQTGWSAGSGYVGTTAAAKPLTMRFTTANDNMNVYFDAALSNMDLNCCLDGSTTPYTLPKESKTIDYAQSDWSAGKAILYTTPQDDATFAFQRSVTIPVAKAGTHTLTFKATKDLLTSAWENQSYVRVSGLGVTSDMVTLTNTSNENSPTTVYVNGTEMNISSATAVPYNSFVKLVSAPADGYLADGFALTSSDTLHYYKQAYCLMDGQTKVINNTPVNNYAEFAARNDATITTKTITAAARNEQISTAIQSDPANEHYNWTATQYAWVTDAGSLASSATDQRNYTTTASLAMDVTVPAGLVYKLSFDHSCASYGVGYLIVTKDGAAADPVDLNSDNTADKFLTYTQNLNPGIYHLEFRVKGQYARLKLKNFSITNQSQGAIGYTGEALAPYGENPDITATAAGWGAWTADKTVAVAGTPIKFTFDSNKLPAGYKFSSVTVGSGNTSETLDSNSSFTYTPTQADADNGLIVKAVYVSPYVGIYKDTATNKIYANGWPILIDSNYVYYLNTDGTARAAKDLNAGVKDSEAIFGGDTVYGGGNGVAVASAKVKITGLPGQTGDQTLTVFGGGINANVTGDVQVDLGFAYTSDSAANIYGGCLNGTVGGSVTFNAPLGVSLAKVNLYGGGLGGSVAGDVNMTVNSDSSGKLGSVTGGGVGCSVGGSIVVTLKSATITGDVTGGPSGTATAKNVTLSIDNNSKVTGNVTGAPGAAQDVTMTVGGTVGGNVTGAAVSARNVQMTLTDSISGGVTGDVIAVAAKGTAQTVTLTAGSAGSVTGIGDHATALDVTVSAGKGNDNNSGVGNITHNVTGIGASASAHNVAVTTNGTVGGSITGIGSGASAWNVSATAKYHVTGSVTGAAANSKVSGDVTVKTVTVDSSVTGAAAGTSPVSGTVTVTTGTAVTGSVTGVDGRTAGAVQVITGGNVTGDVSASKDGSVTGDAKLTLNGTAASAYTVRAVTAAVTVGGKAVLELGAGANITGANVTAVSPVSSADATNKATVTGGTVLTSRATALANTVTLESRDENSAVSGSSAVNVYTDAGQRVFLRDNGTVTLYVRYTKPIYVKENGTAPVVDPSAAGISYEKSSSSDEEGYDKYLLPAAGFAAPTVDNTNHVIFGNGFPLHVENGYVRYTDASGTHYLKNNVDLSAYTVYGGADTANVASSSISFGPLGAKSPRTYYGGGRTGSVTGSISLAFGWSGLSSTTAVSVSDIKIYGGSEDADVSASLYVSLDYNETAEGSTGFISYTSEPLTLFAGCKKGDFTGSAKIDLQKSDRNTDGDAGICRLKLPAAINLCSETGAFTGNIDLYSGAQSYQTVVSGGIQDTYTPTGATAATGSSSGTNVLHLSTYTDTDKTSIICKNTKTSIDGTADANFIRASRDETTGKVTLTYCITDSNIYAKEYFATMTTLKNIIVKSGGELWFDNGTVGTEDSADVRLRGFCPNASGTFYVGSYSTPLEATAGDMTVTVDELSESQFNFAAYMKGNLTLNINTSLTSNKQFTAAMPASVNIVIGRQDGSDTTYSGMGKLYSAPYTHLTINHPYTNGVPFRGSYDEKNITLNLDRSKYRTVQKDGCCVLETITTDSGTPVAGTVSADGTITGNVLIYDNGGTTYATVDANKDGVLDETEKTAGTAITSSITAAPDSVVTMLSGSLDALYFYGTTLNQTGGTVKYLELWPASSTQTYTQAEDAECGYLQLSTADATKAYPLLSNCQTTANLGGKLSNVFNNSYCGITGYNSSDTVKLLSTAAITSSILFYGTFGKLDFSDYTLKQAADASTGKYSEIQFPKNANITGAPTNTPLYILTEGGNCWYSNKSDAPLANPVADFGNVTYGDTSAHTITVNLGSYYSALESYYSFYSSADGSKAFVDCVFDTSAKTCKLTLKPNLEPGLHTDQVLLFGTPIPNGASYQIQVSVNITPQTVTVTPNDGLTAYANSSDSRWKTGYTLSPAVTLTDADKELLAVASMGGPTQPITLAKTRSSDNCYTFTLGASKNLTLNAYNGGAGLPIESVNPTVSTGWGTYALITAPEGYLVSLKQDGTYLPVVKWETSRVTPQTDITCYLKDNTTDMSSYQLTLQKTIPEVKVCTDGDLATYSGGSVTNITSSTAAVSFTAALKDKTTGACGLGEIKVLAVPTSVSTPTAATILANGVTAAGTSGSCTASLTGLTPNTAYTFYAAHRTEAGVAGTLQTLTNGTTLSETLTVVAAPTAAGTYGTALSALNITGGTVTGAGGKVLTGTWAWTAGYPENTYPRVNGSAYTARFTPDDTRYAPVDASFTPQISPRTVTIQHSSIIQPTKTYDGTAAIPLTSAFDNAVLDGVLSGDSVSVSAEGVTANVAAVNTCAGAGKALTLTGNLTLTGDRAGCYTLEQPTGLTASITAAPQTLVSSNTLSVVRGGSIGKADILAAITGAKGTVTLSCGETYTAPGTAGTGTLTASAAACDVNNDGEPEYLASEPVTITVTVTEKADLSSAIAVTGITGLNKNYNGSPAAYSGTVSVTDHADIQLETAWYGSSGRLENPPVNAGNYTLVFSIPADTAGYAGSKSVPFTISPATVTVSAGSAKVTKTYDGTVAAGTLSGSLTVSGIVGSGVTVAATPTGYADSNVGTGTVSAALALAGDSYGNYVLSANSVTLPCEITRATLTASGTGAATAAYGKKLSEIPITGLTAKLGESEVSGSWAFSGDTVYSVGAAPACTATFTPASGAGNYNTLTASITPTITQTTYAGTLAMTKTVYANHAQTGVEADLSALLNTVGGATIANAAVGSGSFVSNVTHSGSKVLFDVASATSGTAVINVTLTSVNYSNLSAAITVQITDKAAAGVTLSGTAPTEKTYGDGSFTLSAGASAPGANGVWTWSSTNSAVLSVAGNGSTATVTVRSAGSASITASYTSDTTMGEISVPITVNRKTLTITADSKTAYVGDTKPTLTYTVSGLVGSDGLSKDPTLSCDADMTKAGTYTITAAGAAVSGTNYNSSITYAAGKLTVSERASAPGGGGSGGSSSTDTAGTKVTVPVTSNEGSVKVEATVKDSTAAVTISDAQIKEIASGTDSVGTVKLDVSSLDVKAATVPAKVIAAADSSTSATGVEVALPTGTVTLDKTALAAISDKGGDVTVSVDKVDNTKLSETQKEVLGAQADTAVVVDVTVLASGEKVTAFNGGSVGVAVPYTPKSGENTSKLVVWFIRDDGTIEPKTGSYNAATGRFEFQTEHLSQYVLVSFPFSDVSAGSWYYGSVAYAYMNGLFSGTGDTTFSPETTMTRGMLVTVLYRMAGSPATAAGTSFTDVAADAYYAKAVAWASANKLVTGYDAATFAPDDTVTREQMAAILYRYAQLKSLDVSRTAELTAFADASGVSAWAADALRWATGAGLINGSDGRLLPQNGAQRAQVAAILQRFIRNIAK